MTWEMSALLSVLSLCAVAVFAIYRITRDAVNARDLAKALNEINLEMQKLNVTLNPLLRNRDPLGARSQ